MGITLKKRIDGLEAMLRNALGTEYKLFEDLISSITLNIEGAYLDGYHHAAMGQEPLTTVGND